MVLNMTTILASAITSAINGAAMFLSVRYVGKIADRLEKNRKDKSKDED